MSINTHWSRYALAAALAIGGATQASAHSIAAVTNATNFTFAAAGLVPIPGMVTPLFANAANQRFIVTFSSECSVRTAAANTTAWTDIDIQVRNAAGVLVATLQPTVGPNGAFCAANGTAAFDGFESNSLTAVGGVGLPAGAYRIIVMARLNNGAIGGWFGERALVVSR